ncbi:MAG: hypothetical protein KC776_16845 [Myxococcales bacterium]|nr:hypothetical protein [Myxococcales bacterium]MCB9575521.1 hypothetical protein [Polyangiaceae bacterium]
MTCRPALLAALLLLSLGLGACGSDDDSAPATPPTLSVDSFDVPIADLPPALQAAFDDGDIAFSTPLREADGLGPVYTRSACDSCHAEGLRGPGLVQKMSVVNADGVTASSDQSSLGFGHTVHPLVSGGGSTPVLPPDDPSVLVTTRLGPPILGRGYMEAVLDSEIERVEKEQSQRTDGISGRINRTAYQSAASAAPEFDPFEKGDVVIGRFGLKARIATLDDFVADAFQGDMGITSPMRPDEVPNPDGLTDDAKPGLDVGHASIQSRAMYVRLLEIPRRTDNKKGQELFEQTNCSVCHVATLRTRSDYPVALLAGIDAPVYTDFLLHDMGSELADGLPVGVDGDANGFEWRTAPLIGLRFDRTFMHDGRAHSVEQAIVMHRGPGSEANGSIDLFDALSAADRDALIQFVESL